MVRPPQVNLNMCGLAGAKRMEPHMTAALMNNGEEKGTTVGTVVNDITGTRGQADGTRNEYYVEWLLSLRLSVIDPPGATAASGSDALLM